MSPEVTEELIARQPPEAQAIIRILLARIDALEARLAAVTKTPQNSSLPPSTQHPHAKSSSSDSSAAASSKRKRGGQPGHVRHERTLIPIEQCDEVVVLKPKRCRSCGERLSGDDLQPWRHQVWEVPQPRPTVIEYQRHRLTCGCGQTTCADLPEGVPEHTSGPRLVALASLLMAACRQSKSRTAWVLTTLFGVPACAGLVVKLQRRATEALTPCYEELTATLPTAKVVACDETAMKEGRHKSWLWVAATAAYPVFAIRLTRAATVIEGLLGKNFRGIIGTDRYGGYNVFNLRRQLCWAHLKRDFQALIDAGGEPRLIGDRLMKHLHEVFHHWHRYREGKIQRATMQRNILTIYYPLWETLEDGQRSSHAPTAALCRDLFQRFDQLWLFRDHAGVEPTNNRAERSLRHAVIWRKLSHGTQSASGSRFVETLLSVIETCRQQQRDVFDFLTAATEAKQSNKPAPRLLCGA